MTPFNINKIYTNINSSEYLRNIILDLTTLVKHILWLMTSVLELDGVFFKQI